MKGFGDKGSSYEKEGMVKVKGFGDKGSSYEEEEW